MGAELRLELLAAAQGDELGGLAERGGGGAGPPPGPAPPEGVGLGGCAGHWARTLPIARGKGVMFNDLLEVDWAHGSPVNLNLDTCVKLRVAP